MTGVMVKPVGSLCNHGCSYCYYLPTAALYQGDGGVMDDGLLEACIRQTFEACEGDAVSFCWHGGEPLLAGLPFFRKAVRLQKKYADGKRIDNSLQTNGLLVDDSWCRFFRDTLGSRFLQFLPAADRRLPWAVSAKGYGRFLTDVFDEWVSRDVEEYFVQMFDATLAGWYGVIPGVCTVNDVCNDSLVVERNGDVYSCDHFVMSGLLLGNIRENSLKELYDSSGRVSFTKSKIASLPEECRECRYFFACHGECPEHRVNGRNVLCEGLKDYFNHVTPAMDGMKELLLRRRSPAEIMNTWVM